MPALFEFNTTLQGTQLAAINALIIWEKLRVDYLGTDQEPSIYTDC